MVILTIPAATWAGTLSMPQLYAVALYEGDVHDRGSTSSRGGAGGRSARYVRHPLLHDADRPDPRMTPMLDYAVRLRTTVDAAAATLIGVDPMAAARRPASGGWSAQEIVGHLIDSAANNHQRFVRARWQDDLVFTGYAQDAWVDAQRYADAPWIEVVTLWREYNRHLARVMDATPPSVRLREQARHNLHEIAWRTVPVDTPATLDYFMRDYVGHLEHHLRQLAALLAVELVDA